LKISAPAAGGSHWFALRRSIGDGPVAAGDEEFFRAVGMQQHQVGARLHRDGLREVGVIPLMNLISGAQGADVDDVVVDGDLGVFRDGRNDDVERRAEERIILDARLEGGFGGGGRGRDQAAHRRKQQPSS
jgi:hypothetical protein